MRQLIVFLLMLLFCLQSCGQNIIKSNNLNSGKKEKYPPELKEAYEQASQLKNIRSLLVQHHGELIGEAYFKPFPSDSLEHVRSVTKSVMATLIGIAIDKGFIGSVEEPITKYLGKEAIGKETIKIKHLLTMTSGIKWREVTGNMEIDEWINSKSPLQYVLDKPITYPPGSKWEYSTGIIHLLSVILTNASGMSTLAFAEKHLFEPLGIGKVWWRKLNDGYYHGGSRLKLRPKDMMKIGQLYLNEGMFHGKRILSADFINDATTQLQPPGSFDGSDDGYGYAWWVGQGGGVSGYMAQGYGGQTILVIPKEELVIVTTYKWKVSNHDAGKQQQEATNKVASSIIQSILNK